MALQKRENKNIQIYFRFKYQNHRHHYILASILHIDRAGALIFWLSFSPPPIPTAELRKWGLLEGGIRYSVSINYRRWARALTNYGHRYLSGIEYLKYLSSCLRKNNLNVKNILNYVSK